jgi:hypothetical protein
VILAKTRKAASSAKKKTATAKKKSVAKKATGVKKKSAGGKKKAARGTRRSTSAKELDLRPLKRQIKAHVEMLSRATGGDKRISDAIASLRRVQQELDQNCDPTMTIPLA